MNIYRLLVLKIIFFAVFVYFSRDESMNKINQLSLHFLPLSLSFFADNLGSVYNWKL